MKQLAAALTLFALGACGFQPVYGGGAARYAGASEIDVSPIEGRAGYVLRRALQQELAVGLPGLTGPATLTVDLESELTRLAFQPDGAASRSAVIATSQYVLSTDAMSISGKSDVEAGFIVPDAPFGDIAAQTGASDRAMRQLAKAIADDLRLQLAVK